MGSSLSFIVGCALFILSTMVMKAYWPSSDRERHSTTLGLAIFIGFAAAAANTFWWQGFGNLLPAFDLVSREAFRTVGLYLDVLFKGAGAVAAVLHLQALRQSLDDRERKAWSWWEMPWYPRKWACISKFKKQGDHDD